MWRAQVRKAYGVLTKQKEASEVKAPSRRGALPVKFGAGGRLRECSRISGHWLVVLAVTGE